MNRVRAERNLKGLTQEELASELGVAKSTVVRWEGGGSIPQKEIVAMRSLFGCDIDWLLGVSEQRQTILEAT